MIYLIQFPTGNYFVSQYMSALNLANAQTFDNLRVAEEIVFSHCVPGTKTVSITTKELFKARLEG